jgi:Na+-transporting NADH:ubiquinone oxidoreductase subunit NqrE
MTRKTVTYVMTPEDRVTRARWIRGIGAFYLSAALLALAFMVVAGVL